MTCVKARKIIAMETSKNKRREYEKIYLSEGRGKHRGERKKKPHFFFLGRAVQWIVFAEACILPRVANPKHTHVQSHMQLSIILETSLHQPPSARASSMVRLLDMTLPKKAGSGATERHSSYVCVCLPVLSSPPLCNLTAAGYPAVRQQ